MGLEIGGVTPTDIRRKVIGLQCNSGCMSRVYNLRVLWYTRSFMRIFVRF